MTKESQPKLHKLHKLHHISIIDSLGTKCVWVRIRHKGELFQKSFPFKKYGGKSQALKAAIETRDRVGKRIYGKNWPWTKFTAKKISSSNSSGTIGVSYSSGNHAWVASWQEGPNQNRKQRNAYYPVDKHGNNKAKQLALEKRKREVAKNKITK